jgi:hypothetical protein
MPMFFSEDELQERAKNKVPNEKYTAMQLADLEAETEAAIKGNLKWRERGPIGKAGQVWRGQQWRSGSARWANRGGQNAAWYTELYRAQRKGKAAADAFLKANPKPHKD